jgi:hypothetical protein
MQEKEIIQKINDLYILYRKKWLKFDETGYSTISSIITDYHVKNHLQGYYTLGVFAGEIFTKFICFDVDVKDPQMAKWTVYKLVDTLQEIGISGEYIYISTSGNKGYHIEIFFNKPVFNTDIKQFYLMVLNYAELLNIDYGKVELRPTNTQGVKIPLGKHFTTNRICWYVDYEQGLKPIEDYDYVLCIQQMDTEFFYDLMNKAKDSIDITEQQALEYENIVSKHKPLKIYQENIDPDVTIETIENLIKTGLKMQGTRHNALLKIAKYNKYIGLSADDNKQFLIDWMEKQDKRTYTTKWEDVLKDIDLIIQYTYERNYSLTIRQSNITISANEIEEILKIKGKNHKLVLYALLVHSKRYANKDGVFSMAYSQMVNATGLSDKTVKTIIKELEQLNIIQVFRSKEYNYNKELNKSIQDTNKYKINLYCVKLYNPENVKSISICNKNCQNCFNACLCRLYDKKQLKSMLTRREYEALIKNAELNNMPCIAG